MSTLKVVNLQNPASSIVNAVINADGSSSFNGPVTFDSCQLLSVFSSTTGPVNPPVGTLWYNITALPYSLSIWNGSTWTVPPGAEATPTVPGAVYGVTDTDNTGVGYCALALTVSPENAGLGCNALGLNVMGVQNASFGDEALANNTVGCQNTAAGWEALKYNTVGLNNTAVGGTTLCCNQTGCRNTAVGRSALRCNVSGSFNTAIGTSALQNNVTGSNNMAFGNRALECNLTGEDNGAFGQNSLINNTSGCYNSALGSFSLCTVSTGCGNIGLGAYTSAGTISPVFSVTTQNDRVVIGTTSVTNAYIQVAWTVVSDARDKNVEGPVPHGLEFVKGLKPVSYHFKASREDATSHGPLRYGFLAQDILALEGESGVIIDNTDSEKLRYQGESLVPVLVNAIQELAKENEILKSRLDAAGI